MTVVVGYSPSSQGRAALAAAVRRARRTGEGLVVASHQYHDPEQGLQAAGEPAVREALGEDAADLEVSVRLGPEQDIGEFLLEIVEETSASLLVIGLRRKSPIGKLNLGASARRIVLSAPCPVLTVKDDAAREAVAGSA